MRCRIFLGPHCDNCKSETLWLCTANRELLYIALVWHLKVMTSCRECRQCHMTSPIAIAAAAVPLAMAVEIAMTHTCHEITIVTCLELWICPVHVPMILCGDVSLAVVQ